MRNCGTYNKNSEVLLRLPLPTTYLLPTYLPTYLLRPAVLYYILLYPAYGPQTPLLPTTYYLLPTTYYLLPTTYYLLPTTYYLLPTTYYLPPTTYYLLHTTYYRQVLVATDTLQEGIDIPDCEWAASPFLSPTRSVTYDVVYCLVVVLECSSNRKKGYFRNF